MQAPKEFDLILTLDLVDDGINVGLVLSLSAVSDAVLSVGGLGVAITDWEV